MTQVHDVITLTPEEEATRLWAGALSAFEKAAEDFVSLSQALDLGARAVEILAVQHLRGVAVRFPATIASYLEVPDENVVARRDAVAEPHSLQFIDIVDVLSDEGLECVSPHLHRGWEDRRFSCQRSRKTARDAVGFGIDPDAYDRLLLLAAYRNRIFRVQPPVVIKASAILDAFPALVSLYERLAGA